MFKWTYGLFNHYVARFVLNFALFAANCIRNFLAEFEIDRTNLT